MANFVEQVVVSVSELTIGTTLKNGKIVTADSNGFAPVFLTVLAGKCPNRQMISGTIANNLGIQPNKTYVLQVREVEANEYGRQFIFEAPSELNVMERISAIKMLGNAIIINVNEGEHVASQQESLIGSVEKF